MNIFASDISPIISAQNLDDRRLVKMTLESAQLLSTTLGGPYKPTHQRHPCTLWVKEHPSHALWLYHHFLALSDEYTYRFDKIHKSLITCEGIFRENFRTRTNPYPYYFRAVPGNFVLLPSVAATFYQTLLTYKWTKSPGRFTRRPPPPFYPLRTESHEAPPPIQPASP